MAVAFPRIYHGPVHPREDEYLDFRRCSGLSLVISQSTFRPTPKAQPEGLARSLDTTHLLQTITLNSKKKLIAQA